MSTFTVRVTRQGFVQGVHHNIRAAGSAAAIEIARMFYPAKARGLKFVAEEV